MLEWCEVPANFNLVSGQATKGMKTVVAGAKLKKINAYQEMADYVNAHCSTKWTRENAKSRFESYLGMFKSTKKLMMDVGNEKFMLGPKDFAAGIRTLKEKK